ncbi:transmembrane protein, putative (macronuclear) [Tetrahymena thermophila SB210]|uniref:Transmembrane protein, putative n=1 Tax=Tetrahymena thermophila (strain SB210) TaxID=312017 RepID=I7LX22_TETTS|nr:transmembrane protein, putative [Tetrahymena thermophila SB210]EAS03291.2 transmembrane protein, putative [Tetrahymena thermophila SB210]|eukprot:XP_001023536.2 transmembrane protein, putative [Tetrahymena thermophila SB210]
MQIITKVNFYKINNILKIQQMRKIAIFVFFLSYTLQADIQCQANCLQCKVDEYTLNKTCLQCQKDYYLIQDLLICVKECPNNYYLDTDSNLCIKCHHSCKSCSGNLQSQCLECQNNRDLFRSKFPGEGFCFCQNEIYQPSCSTKQQGFYKICQISTFVILALAFILSILELNINYFIITVAFFQDISTLSLINITYPLQLQQLFSYLSETMFNFGSFIPQIIQNNVNDLNNKLIFYGNPKFVLIKYFSPLFLLNIYNYFGLLIFFLALKKIKCFNNKKVKQLMLKNKNGMLMIFQLLQGNITLLFGLYEIINFRLQLRNEFYVEIINKLFLLTFFYTNIIWNSKLLGISQSDTILQINIKNIQNKKCQVQEYKIQQSMLVTQIINSIIINMAFQSPNLQIFLLLFVQLCQLI